MADSEYMAGWADKIVEQLLGSATDVDVRTIQQEYDLERNEYIITVYGTRGGIPQEGLLGEVVVTGEQVEQVMKEQE